MVEWRGLGEEVNSVLKEDCGKKQEEKKKKKRDFWV